MPINQAPHVNRYAEASCGEPFILINQAPHLKSLMREALCRGAVFHRGMPCARCARIVVAAGKLGVSSPGGNDRIDCSGY